MSGLGQNGSLHVGKKFRRRFLRSRTRTGRDGGCRINFRCRFLSKSQDFSQFIIFSLTFRLQKDYFKKLFVFEI